MLRRESSFLGFYDGGESYFTHITPFSVWRKGAPHGWTPFQYSDPNASECVAVTAAVVPVPGSADGADLAPTRCWKGRVALDQSCAICLRYASLVDLANETSGSSPSDWPAPHALNGTFSVDISREEAVRIIRAHPDPATTPLFM